MSEPLTIEQLPSLTVDDLAGEEGRIRTAIADLFKRRRLVRTLIRGHEQAEQLIAKRDGKPVRVAPAHVALARETEAEGQPIKRDRHHLSRTARKYAIGATAHAGIDPAALREAAAWLTDRPIELLIETRGVDAVQAGINQIAAAMQMILSPALGEHGAEVAEAMKDTPRHSHHR